MSKSQDTPLRLMIVDDSSEAAEGIVTTLRNAGIAVRPLRPASEDEFAAMVGAQPVDLVVAMAVPEHFAQEHLHRLAEVAERFSDAGFRAALRAARTPAALYQLLVAGPPTGV